MNTSNRKLYISAWNVVCVAQCRNPLVERANGKVKLFIPCNLIHSHWYEVFPIAHDENDTADTASLASQNSRRRQLADRLHRPARSPAVGPTTPLSELVNLRANAGSLSHFTIFIEVRQSSAPNSIDKILGKTCVPYPESTTFLGKSLLLSVSA